MTHCTDDLIWQKCLFLPLSCCSGEHTKTSQQTRKLITDVKLFLMPELKEVEGQRMTSVQAETAARVCLCRQEGWRLRQMCLTQLWRCLCEAVCHFTEHRAPCSAWGGDGPWQRSVMLCWPLNPWHAMPFNTTHAWTPNCFAPLGFLLPYLRVHCKWCMEALRGKCVRTRP